MRGMKLGNEYAALGTGLDAPKAVWKAIAISLAARIVAKNPGDGEVSALLAAEWMALHENGIVPQRPR